MKKRYNQSIIRTHAGAVKVSAPCSRTLGDSVEASVSSELVKPGIKPSTRPITRKPLDLLGHSLPNADVHKLNSFLANLGAESAG